MYVTQHIAQKVREATADGSDSEEDRKEKRKPKWTLSLSKDEKMFCIALAQEDNYSDVEDADDKIRKYTSIKRKQEEQPSN